MEGAPLVRCFDAQYAEGVGYHVLLEDLANTHHDRRNVLPTLAYGKAVARALGRMHRHHWQSHPAPGQDALLHYMNEARPGLAAIEQATGQKLHDLMRRHEDQLLRRWSSPKGMSLLHGDLNPTNVLTPKTADSPVYFLDRQPFSWSLTYGVAVHDLAYFLVLWWPPDTRRACEYELLRHWYEAVAMADYTWSEARVDWALSVEQCMNVPLEWCSKAHTLDSMRWLWEVQLSRVQDALSRGHGQNDA
jgi:aminoglycoside phosphotransferase (APT) family kinase protein